MPDPSGMPWPPPEWQDPSAVAQADQGVLAQGYPWPPVEWNPTSPSGSQPGLDDPPPGVRPMMVDQGQPAPAPAPQPAAPPPVEEPDNYKAMPDQGPVVSKPQAQPKGGKQPAPAPKAKPGDFNQYGNETAQTLEEQQALNTERGRTLGAQADVEAQGLGEEAQAAEMADTANQYKQARREADLELRLQKYEQHRQEVANTKINDKQFFEDQSTGERIGWTVAAALAGIVGVQNGTGRNSAIELINQMVDRNLEAQKANLANKRAGVDNEMTLLEMYRAKYKDEAEADAMWKVSAIDNVRKKFAAESAKYKNPLVQQEMQAANLTLEQQNRDTMYKLGVDTNQRQFENKMQERQVGIAAYNARTQRMGMEAEARAREMASAAAMAKLGKEDRERAILGPDGQPIVDKQGHAALAPDAKVAFEERQKEAAGQAYYEELRRYEEFTRGIGREFGGGWGTANTDALARAKSQHKSLMMKYKRAEQLGALDKGAIDVFNSVVQPPETWTSGSNPEASANEAARVYKDTQNVKMRQVYGYQGNWVDDFEERTNSFKPGSTDAKGNRQGGKWESVLFVDPNTYEVGPNVAGPIATYQDVQNWKAIQEKRALEATGGKREDFEYKRQQNQNARDWGRPVPFPEIERPARPPMK